MGEADSKIRYSKANRRLLLKERIVTSIKHDSQIPTFKATTARLIEVLNSTDVHAEQISALAKLDPGITSKLLKLASAPVFGAHEITSIQDALMIVGVNEVRNLATSSIVIEQFNKLKIKVDWNLFWLHSVLTARLTERFADAYRPSTGMEYMAGLLHDVGKLFLEHYFPKEFELVILLSSISNRGMYEAETQLLDTHHAEVSALLCKEWHLHGDVIRGVQFHHDPLSQDNKNPEDPKYAPFLALCITIADKVANLCHANIQGGEPVEQVEIQSLREWKRLKQFTPVKTLILDVATELQKAKEMIAAVL